MDGALVRLTRRGEENTVEDVAAGKFCTQGNDAFGEVGVNDFRSAAADKNAVFIQ